MSHGSAENGADVMEPEAPAERVRTIDLVPAERVMDLAPMVFPLVQKACDFSGGRHDPHATLQACAGQIPDRIMQLWVFGSVGGGEEATIDAIGVTQVNEYPTGLKTLEMVLVGGSSSDEWLPFEDRFAEIARVNGCQRLECFGRRGWAKRLPHWKGTYMLFEREIEPMSDEAAEAADG